MAEISFEILLTFFEDHIKDNREHFVYNYPEDMLYSGSDNRFKFKRLEKNFNLRLALTLDFLKSEHDFTPSHNELIDIKCRLRQRLTKPTQHIIIKTRNFVEEEDYEPSDDDTKCRKCKSYQSRIKKLEEKLKVVEAEREAFKTALELENLNVKGPIIKLSKVPNAKNRNRPEFNKFWALAFLKCQDLNISIRSSKALFIFLKENVPAMNNIDVPSETWIHDCRYLIPTFFEHFIRLFIENSQRIYLGVDGTSFRLGKQLAIVLFDTDTSTSVLLGIKRQVKATGKCIREDMEAIMGDKLELILSKLVGVVSDTEAAQNLAIDYLKLNKNLQNRIFKLRCIMHFVSNAEVYIFDRVDPVFQVFIDKFSNAFGKNNSDYSKNNIKDDFEFYLKKSNYKIFVAQSKMSSRFGNNCRNSKLVYLHYSILVKFCQFSLKDNNNSDLKTILTSLTNNKVDTLVTCGIYATFWTYFCRPIFNYFSKPLKLGEAKEIISDIRNILVLGSIVETPLNWLTEQCVDLFQNRLEIAFTEDDCSFCSKFMGDYLKGSIHGSNFSATHALKYDRLTRNIFRRLTKKWASDWDENLLNVALTLEESEYKFHFSNARTESVFGLLKTEQQSKTMLLPNLMQRTLFKFNNVLPNILNLDQDKQSQILDQAFQDKKKNREFLIETDNIFKEDCFLNKYGPSDV